MTRKGKSAPGQSPRAQEEDGFLCGKVFRGSEGQSKNGVAESDSRILRKVLGGEYL